MNSILSISNISKIYKKNNVKALTDITFQCEKGSILSILGRSGSGKSTLLRLIAGLESSDSGQIILNDKILNSNLKFVQPENRDIDIVFQDFSLFPNMTVKENIFFGKKADSNKEMLQDLIKITHIKDILNRYPHEISGGQAQRVAIVRSLGNNPSILLMDEPLSQLDNNLKEDIRNELMIIFEKFEITVLIATHDIEDALYMSDKTIILNKGKLQQFDNLVNIYKYPNSEYSALLFGNSNIIPRDYIPSVKHHFYKNSINKEVISIRPEQFIINTDRVNDNTISIDCEIKDIIEMGFKYIIKMIHKDLILTAEINNDILIKIGDIKTFYILMD
tara:strand:- start:193 stop:1194 length:1002 start_codon:yes stop_codon:yes gene_type:complete